MKRVAFTIVLNGMPFIKDQYKIIPNIFDHWYIVEGVSENVKCTKWCNSISDKYHINNLSNDGTTEFLDSIQGDNISIIRPSENKPWAGKVEMCNSFMRDVSNCILMQVDVDEFWHEDILSQIFKYCEQNPDRFDAMQFRCRFFLGNNIITSQSNTYGDMSWDWWRLWMIREPTSFISHEPPKISKQKRAISKNDTYQQGWIFDHYAYVNEKQVQFKEDFYGYKNAVSQWKKLNRLSSYDDVDAKDYLAWIKTRCMVTSI